MPIPKGCSRKVSLPGIRNKLAMAIKSSYMPLGGMVAALLAATGNAQMVTDGSLGPARNLQGPDFVISNDLGTQVGSNLFHSFTDFNINSGESATFTSSFSGATDNIISRVTGISPSNINGTLRSNVPGADVWLMNPNGIVMDSRASIHVPAAFHATTADYLNLEGNGRFGSDAAIPEDTTLTSAPPRAFGFYDGQTGSITVNSGFLSAPAISLVGGDISLESSSVSGYEITRLSSVDGPGELPVDPADIIDPLQIDKQANIDGIVCFLVVQHFFVYNS